MSADETMRAVADRLVSVGEVMELTIKELRKLRDLPLLRETKRRMHEAVTQAERLEAWVQYVRECAEVEGEPEEPGLNVNRVNWVEVEELLNGAPTRLPDGPLVGTSGRVIKDDPPWDVAEELANAGKPSGPRRLEEVQREAEEAINHYQPWEDRLKAWEAALVVKEAELTAREEAVETREDEVGGREAAIQEYAEDLQEQEDEILLARMMVEDE